MTIVKPSDALIRKTTHLMQEGMNARAFGEYEMPEALGDARWTDELILSTWYMAETGEVPGLLIQASHAYHEYMTNVLHWWLR